MSAPRFGKKNGGRSFRLKLFVAMMLVVLTMTTLGLFLAQRKVAIEAERDLLQDFRNELATLHGVQEVRQATLAERCRTLVERPRIHAALEDNALDLLYPSAKDELRDVLEAETEPVDEPPGRALHARFYRFLDSTGAVIPPPENAEVGELGPPEEAQLALPRVPEQHQTGYLFRETPEGGTVDEVIAMPIISTETGQVIAALVLGFKPVEFGRNRAGSGIKSGIWLGDRLHLPALGLTEQEALRAELARTIATPQPAERSFDVNIAGAPHLLFYKQLNPDSLFPPAYEVAVYPLAEALARRQQIRWHVLIAGAALLLGGFVASHFASIRLSAPVEELAVTSEKDRAQRKRVEAALETTSEELQRSARFSADASHQLKTPVTVLRAGIEELLGREGFAPDVYSELSALLHQTYRITGVVDDLLLLSRMDAGRLQIQFETVNLSQVLEEWIDDLSALPDDLHVKVDTNFPPDLQVKGEKTYITLIVQNLLENAHKYNVPGGRICVAAEEQDDFVVLTVENTGRRIPPAAREHIFERFHRGAVGENVPGHGLGLNLARELARLHGGDLRLVRSDEEWTEFEVRFRSARQLQANGARPA
ncbi:MAG: sensor histidine kinase [Chthoniobacterales bacterium]